MPRLSIIVPFQHDEPALESTLLSLFENRPHDVEVILSHNGDYNDRYGLGADELVLVETHPDDSLIGLINEGLSASGSPIVQVVLPGMHVESSWVEAALVEFRDAQVAAVSPLVSELASNGSEWIGLDAAALPRRVLQDHTSRSNRIMPLLAGGFFRRRVLLGLGGWLDCGSQEAAEVDLGLALRTLDLSSASITDSRVFASPEICEGNCGSYALGQLTGQLALAYSEIADSGVVIESVVARIGHLASGLMNPSTVAERLGWVLGVRDRSLVSRISNRIQAAQISLGLSRNVSAASNQRRAA